MRRRLLAARLREQWCISLGSAWRSTMPCEGAHSSCSKQGRVLYQAQSSGAALTCCCAPKSGWDVARAARVSLTCEEGLNPVSNQANPVDRESADTLQVFRAGALATLHRTHRDSLTAGCVICGQVRLLWPGRPHTAQVLGTPMALSERACRASWSELMRFIDSAMRLLTARRPDQSYGRHGAEHKAMLDAFRQYSGLRHVHQFGSWGQQPMLQAACTRCN